MDGKPISHQTPVEKKSTSNKKQSKTSSPNLPLKRKLSAQSKLDGEAEALMEDIERGFKQIRLMKNVSAPLEDSLRPHGYLS
jgi:hypothetical protein